MKAIKGLISILPALLLASCTEQPSGIFQGYVEGEFVYVAAPAGGRLINLAVRRGDAVEVGALLFELEPDPENSLVKQAEGRAAQARARLDDLKKGLRPSEIASLQAQIERAKANLALSQSEYERRAKLSKDGGVISPEELDRARAQLESNRALLATLEADLETGRQGGRVDQVRAAEAELEAALAAQRQAEWSLQQKVQTASAAGRVQDTLYRPGEYVPSGRPVVSLLPPENLKIRFFVPQPQMNSIAVGDNVHVRMDGVAEPFVAKVRFVSQEAEFTSPIIFSRENRSKLVFMVEAGLEPEDAVKLHPGQPVDVRLSP